MSKHLILLTDVDGLGIVGDVVKVADGFARNYLLPGGKAVPVTEHMKAKLAAARAQRETELAEALEAANVLAAGLEGLTLTIKVKTSGEGRLYGSVGEGDIVKAAKDAGHSLDIKQINMGPHIRQLGSYSVRVRLHRDVAVKINVDVVEDQGE